MPSAIEEALGFCGNLLGQPHCQIVEPGERHWEISRGLCIETETREESPRVTDAWFAALAIEWGCEWITLDRDYARFPRLKWQVPKGRPRLAICRAKLRRLTHYLAFDLFARNSGTDWRRDHNLPDRMAMTVFIWRWPSKAPSLPSLPMND